jgi:hypothetical protein
MTAPLDTLLPALTADAENFGRQNAPLKVDPSEAMQEMDKWLAMQLPLYRVVFGNIQIMRKTPISKLVGELIEPSCSNASRIVHLSLEFVVCFSSRIIVIPPPVRNDA